MTDWLALLKNKKTPDGGATKPTKPGFVGFVAPLQGVSTKLHVNDEAVHSGFVGFVALSVESFQNSSAYPDRTREFENTGSRHATKPTKPSAARWLVRFPDRLLELTCAPDRTRDEVLQIYPDALDAEPLAERMPADLEAFGLVEGQRCTRCQHYRRPGKSAGYCTGRDDLPHVYGLLHELPADMGVNCKEFARC